MCDLVQTCASIFMSENEKKMNIDAYVYVGVYGVGCRGDMVKSGFN